MILQSLAVSSDMQSGRIGIVKEEEDKISQEVLERDNDRVDIVEQLRT